MNEFVDEIKSDPTSLSEEKSKMYQDRYELLMEEYSENYDSYTQEDK